MTFLNPRDLDEGVRDASSCETAGIVGVLYVEYFKVFPKPQLSSPLLFLFHVSFPLGDLLNCLFFQIRTKSVQEYASIFDALDRVTVSFSWKS